MRFKCEIQIWMNDVGKLRILKIWVNKMSKWINCTYELKSETLCMHYLYESKLASLGL